MVSRPFSQLRKQHALDGSESRRLILDQTKIYAMVEH
jgi:hypothetical protein